MAKLQSQKYRTCIDACNECFEACEICAVKCLHDEDVKSMTKCIELCLTCSHTCAAASVVMSGEKRLFKEGLRSMG
jgi:Synapsin, ATP binding domain